VVEIQPTDVENDERDIVTGKTNSLRKVMERLHLSSAGAAEDQPAAEAEAETTQTPTDDQSAAPVAAKSRLGIVKKVDSAARTCVVRWLTGQHTKASEKAESESENEKVEVEEEESAAKNEDEGEEEEVSFYQIMIHPDFKYRLGDLVLKLPGTGGDSAALEQQESAQGQWVGELVGLRDGKLLVQWSDSTTSWVGPEQVYALDTYVLPPPLLFRPGLDWTDSPFAIKAMTIGTPTTTSSRSTTRRERRERRATKRG
jgi:hypothetical protein